MGLFGAKAGRDDMSVFYMGGLGESGKPGKHRGGNLHGDPKDKATGRHQKPIVTGKAAKAMKAAAKKGKK